MSESIALFHRPFYFLRHGETEANLARVISGSREVDLTARGREQAHVAALVLGAEPISAIYSSPLRRARETGERTATALRLRVAVVARRAPARRARRHANRRGR